MSALWHTSNGVLFRLIINVDTVGLYLSMSECLVLSKRLFGRVVKTACGACVLSVVRGLNDAGTRGLGVGLLQAAQLSLPEGDNAWALGGRIAVVRLQLTYFALNSSKKHLYRIIQPKLLSNLAIVDFC